MPTNVTGLLVFVALLAPGFCHLLVLERQVAPGKPTPSPLRELASLALVSVAADGVVVAGYLSASEWWPSLPRLEDYVFQSGAWKQSLGTGLALLSGLVVGACLLAYAWAAANAGDRLRRKLETSKGTAWLLPLGSADISSSWWQMLYDEQPDKYKWVVCTLTDGSTVAGWLRSFNNRVAEVGDRDIILSAPIVIRGAEAGATTENFEYGSVVVSAREIRLTRVEYHLEGPGSIP